MTTSERAASASDLYEEDFYAWTQRQAASLRVGDLSQVDLVNIPEEIETSGRREVSELRSRLGILSAHLFEEMFQPERSTRSWTTTILNQRIAIADHMDDSPSLEPKLADTFTEAYDDARDLASARLVFR